MIKEAPDEDYACFLTNFGSLLQTAMVGFTGIRGTHPGRAKYPATLPEGWDKLEIDQMWVRGEAKRMVAVNGRLTTLTTVAMWGRPLRPPRAATRVTPTRNQPQSRLCHFPVTGPACGKREPPFGHPCASFLRRVW